MANQADVQAVLDTVVTKVNGLGDQLADFTGDFAAAISALQAQIGAGSTDLQPQVDALSALATKLDGFATSLKGLDTTAEEISGVPTPPAA